MINQYNYIGQRIKKLRLYLQLTGKSFGETIGITKQAVSMIENNQRDVSSVLIRKIVDRFKIDARYFFGQLDSLEEADLSRSKKNDSNNINPDIHSAIEALSLEIKYLEREIKHIKDFLRTDYTENIEQQPSNRISHCHGLLSIIHLLLPLDQRELLKILKILEDYLSTETEDKPADSQPD